MKISNKSKISAITFVILLTISATLVALPIATAHDPPLSYPTFAYIAVSPDTVGVGQDAIIYIWTSISPVPTAQGAYGDRWEGYEVEVTKPDGTTQTLGPFTSDPIGFAYTMYTPDQVGTYTFQNSFPGQTLAGNNMHPTDITGREYIGDYFEPSTSDVISLTVQAETVELYPTTPLPDDYWTRPIDAQHRDWWPISGNWLESPPTRNDFPFAPYTEGPETAHILWTKELTFGGLVGGEFNVHSFHCGNAYEGKWFPTVIIAGVLYYNKYPDDLYANRYADSWPRRGKLPGFYAVDLRTGEELYYNNETRIDFGQIYMYDSPNQHGAFAYLWAKEGTTWHAYDAYDGHYVYSMENVPSGTQTSGPKGEIFIYQLNTKGDWLALWNSSAIPELAGAPAGTENWQWRPYGKTVDGQKGYMWNVTVPADLTGSINFVLEDRVIGSIFADETLTVWALSLKPGEQGKLLWSSDYTAPRGASGVGRYGAGLILKLASLEDEVFVVWCAATRQWWGYSLNDGSLLWGPTDSQGVWDYTVSTVGSIAYGKLVSRGYAGIVYCYDVKTGDLEWTWEAEDPYYLEALWAGNYVLDAGFIADRKVYVISGEHSANDPKERAAPLACIDIDTGEELWQIPFYSSHWANNPAIADGIINYLNIYDNRIYSFGKGPSKTTVSAPETGVPLGSSVMIRGTVADQCAGAKRLVQDGKLSIVPAISDEDMSEWMKYLYMQFPIPADATGVPVTLDVIDPNGNFISIGRVTSDMSGFYSYQWTPEVEGKYTIIATFEGSKSYYSSYAETAIGVDPAPSPAEPIEPEPTEPTEPEAAEAPLITTETAIIAAVAVAVVIGIAAYWILKKRK